MNDAVTFENATRQIISPEYLLAEGKKHFLVFRNNKYFVIETSSIAFIHIRYSSAAIVTFSGQEYPIPESLDRIQVLLATPQFYRINRQYLINFQAIKEVEHYFARKLWIKLVVPTNDLLLIRKEKKKAFLHWLESR